MQFPQLLPATLIRRYKRFLADIQLPDGQILTIHCAATGTMLGCSEPGSRIWYWDSQSDTRKYPHSWELTELPNGKLVCINTHRANPLVQEALQHKVIQELADYQEIYPEVKYGEENSRIDFLLKGEGLPDCYLEVKSITLVRDGLAGFPDAVTTRGQKHLRELLAMKRQGHRAVVLFAGLHNGFDRFQAAADIDPVYAKLLQEVRALGVEAYAYAGQFECLDGRPISLALSHSVPLLD